MENAALLEKISELKNEDGEILSSDLLDFAEASNMQEEMDLIYETVRQAGVNIVFTHDDEPDELDEGISSKAMRSKKRPATGKTEGGSSKDINLLEQYLKDCSVYECLSPERTTELFRKMRAGSEYAKELLISSNLRLVVSIVKKYNRHGMDIMDLIQEGNIGLMEAVRKFDPDKGYRLSTYSGFWIKMRIEKSIKEKSQSIRVPAKIIERLGRIVKAKTEFENTNKREPTIKELSQLTGLSALTIKRSEVIPICDTSLDQSFEDDPRDDSRMNSIVKENDEMPETVVENQQKTQAVLQALKKIPQRERYILTNNFGIGTEPQSLSKIGKSIGLTRERVRQLRNDALVMLQDELDLLLLCDEDDDVMQKIA